MNIELFNRQYTIRRFGEQTAIRGYISSGFADMEVSIHIHPGSEQMQALPEGERGVKRLEGHGDVQLYTAETNPNRKADLLYYEGEWYECVSSEYWSHTLLSHWNYQFVVVPGDASGSPDFETPPETPK